MSDSWAHRCLVVPDSHVELACQLTVALAGDAGAGMWTTPLSPTGDLPATHWISAGLITEEFASLLPCADLGYPGNAAAAAYLTAQAGFVTTASQVQSLFDASDCTSEDPHSALHRLGLVLTNARRPVLTAGEPDHSSV